MDEQARSLLGVVAVLRAALIIWASIVVVIDITGTTDLNSALAVGALFGLASWSAMSLWMVRSRPVVATSVPFVVLDAVIAATTIALDPVIYPGPHPQSFASAWPLSGAVVTGIVLGRRAGAISGLAIGAAGAISVALVEDGGLNGRLMGALGTVVLIGVAGALAGLVTSRLREAELTRARAQLREEVSRTLHDGVLQTLAVIQRRSSDTELIGLARDQEAELRDFINSPGSFGDARSSHGDEMEQIPLSVLLRRAIRSTEHRHAITCDLVIVDEPERVDPRIVSALTGAVAESMTNAAKHSGTQRVSVFVDWDGTELMCEVRDVGVGFDPQSTERGVGIDRSITARMEEIGGRVSIESSPGHGTLVIMSVPLGAVG